MAEFYKGEQFLQPELPSNSPKPAETPPEGVIMTDTAPDGWTRRYLYRALAGSTPEEIVISETGPQGLPETSVAVEEPLLGEGAEAEVNDDFMDPLLGAEIPEGIHLPEGALLPDHAVFSGLPSEAPPKRSLLGRNVPVTMTALSAPKQEVKRSVSVQRAPLQTSIPQPFLNSGVPAMGMKQAPPPVSISVQQAAAPLLGASIAVPGARAPELAKESPSVVRLSNSLAALKPVAPPMVSEANKLRPTPPKEASPVMLGQIAKSLPLSKQDQRQVDTYPVNNPIAPVAAPTVGSVDGPTAFVQNRIPLKRLGQQQAPASQAATPESEVTKCPGAVEMPDGRVIEPGDSIILKDLCELVPFLVETLGRAGDGRISTNQRPGMPIPTQGPGFGPAGGGPYGHNGGGFVSGGGGAPGPVGPVGPLGPVGPRGPGSIVEPPVVKTDGDFTAGPGAFAPVPGTSLAFSLPAAGIAQFNVTATFGSTTGVIGAPENGQLGLRIDGTDYPLSTRLIHTFAAGVGEFLIGQNSVFALSLGAGSHMVEVVIRGLVAGEFGGAGLGAPLTIAASPSVPLILTVSHS